MHTLDLEIDYTHEHYGWINCTLTADGTPHHLSASGALPPFSQLMYFIKAAAGNDLPHSFEWDEEGFGARFEVTAVTNRPLLHLNITHHMDNRIEVWIDADMERETIVEAFLPPLVDFVQNFTLRGWAPPRRIVENFQKTVEKGLPLRPDLQAPKHVEFIIYPSYGGMMEDHVNLQIWLNDDFRLHYSLQDTDPFWNNLVGFLEKIASGDFPAQAEYIDNMRLSMLGVFISSPLEQFENKHRILATAVDQSENFRLRHYMNEAQNQYEELVMDEIVNRQQFTHTFVESFNEFLQSHYQVSEDGIGKVFDLRSLSLKKIFER